MNETSPETLSVVVERELSQPPEKIWRALTLPHLIEEWLMKSDSGRPWSISSIFARIGVPSSARFWK